MPDTERKELKRHQSRSETRTFGWPEIIVFGIPFAAFGLSVILVGLKTTPTELECGSSPNWMIYWFGIFFLFTGIFIIILGIKGIRRNSRKKRLLAHFPHEPWLADNPWDFHGIKDDNISTTLRAFSKVVFLTLFLIPFNWWAFFSSFSGIIITLITVVFDVATILLYMACLYRLGRLIKYGTSHIQFKRFPFFLGESLEVIFSYSKGLERIHKLIVTLLCIQEVREKRGEDHTTVCYQLFDDSHTIDLIDSSNMMLSHQKISFPLPEGDYFTSLIDMPMRYWELEIEAQDITRTIFSATYLVPVYTRPQALRALGLSHSS
ncbi:MAG: hypothetical protein JSV03_06135 [Planctomycetota bacterium]|nr:MAG: hypothetical protein JSV03_06135 [Planctomycetota bacterium]